MSLSASAPIDYDGLLFEIGRADDANIKKLKAYIWKQEAGSKLSWNVSLDCWYTLSPCIGLIAGFPHTDLNMRPGIPWIIT